jgi:hypothetical protein
MSLTCFRNVNGQTREMSANDLTSGSYGCSSSVQWSSAAYAKLTNVNAQQDLSLAIWGVNAVFQATGSGTDACVRPSLSTNFEADKGAFGISPSMDSLRMTIPAGSIKIPGCGSDCAAFSPPANVKATSCAAESVPAGTACDVQCSDGYTATGSAVSCVGGPLSGAGSYAGGIACTNGATSASSCTNGACPSLSALVNNDKVTQIVGPGCGAVVATGTKCAFSCDVGQGKFSVGNLQAQGGNAWTQTDGAMCADCTGATCAAALDAADVESPTVLVDGTVCLEGDNLDGSNDMAILVAGGNANCGDPNSVPIGGLFLPCNAKTGACTSASGTNALECVGFPSASVPQDWTVCLCDSDAAADCSIAANYGVQGPRTQASAGVPGVLPQGNFPSPPRGQCALSV